MAPRKTTSPPPEAPVRTPDQMRRRIDVLKKCIDDLQKFNPEQVQKRHNVPEVVTLEASIADALASAFGHGTPRYNLFKSAADLDQGPHVVRLAPAFGRGPTPNYEAIEAHKARQYLAEGKPRSIQFLERAISALENDIAEREAAQPAAPATARPRPSRKVFVVHGHDEAALQAVARFLEKLGLEAIILREEPDAGRTIIEKFEDCADDVGFAVVLITPDDFGGAAATGATASRARQNVIFELGYFAGKLGRGCTCLMRKGAVEIPSDLYGVIYTEMDNAEGWKLKLVKELKAARLNFDANRMWG